MTTCAHKVTVRTQRGHLSATVSPALRCRPQETNVTVRKCVICIHVFMSWVSGIDCICDGEICGCLQMWMSVWSYLRPVMVWGSVSISWVLTSAIARRDIDKSTAPAATVRQSIKQTHTHSTEAVFGIGY